MIEILVSLFFSGLAFGSGPCLTTCGPVLLSYIAGTEKNVPKSLLIYGIFSLARVSSYCFLALVVFWVGRAALEQFLLKYAHSIMIAGGVLFILLGILTAAGKNLELKAFSFCRRFMLERDKKSVAAMGFVMGLLPCGPLVIILSYIGLVARSWSASVGYSLVFGLGTFISPLVALVVLAGLIPRLTIARKRLYRVIFNITCGVILVYFGIQLIRRAFG